MLLCFNVSHASPADSGKDYLSAADVRGGRIISHSAIESTGTKSKTSALSRYEAFNGQLFDLVENRGRYVNVLVPESFEPGPFFTADHLEEMVDRLDMLYALYTEMLGFEPSGQGLLNIAFVPQSCGVGCGLLGHKGIEIESDSRNYENIIRELDQGRLETILVHELVHNFDSFEKYLHYLPDHAHAWTDMFEYFAPYRYARNSLNNQAPDDIFNSPVRSVWKNYIANDSADWVTCVKNSACEDAGLTANNLWAMLYYRIEALHGEEALLRSFEFIREYKRTYVAPKTDTDKEGLRVLSLAVGVGANISCYMDELRWPVPESVRNEMTQRFGSSGAFCEDKDQDGFSAINGDCDDTDASRNFFSHEIAGNGKDDDCDDLVDEDSLVESEQGTEIDNFHGTVQTHLPFEVIGNAANSDDSDNFQFPVTSTGRARITLCATDEFKGWAVALKPDGSFMDTPNWYAYQAGAGCTSNSFDYLSFSKGGLSIMPDESSGEYSLTVSEAAELPPELAVYLEAHHRSAGGVTLEVDDRDDLLAQLGADEVEFWVSGAGIQIFQPFSSAMSVSLAPSQYPQLVDGERYQVRIRPRADGLPLAAVSAGHAFTYDKGPQTLQLDHRFSGAWFDPEHSGEGFIVEVLGDTRALVYWFSFHRDGSQRWMLGVGEVQDNRIVIRDLMDSHGGRFGKNFNPNDVVLNSVGSLSITFDDCTQAIANFSVDGIGGHQSLGRLTNVYGHECGSNQAPPSSDISGSWFDPTHSGEGFIVEQVSADQAVVFWFTYDDAGKQSWLMSTGTIAGNRISFPHTIRPVGGQFGRSFDPAGVVQQEWGDLDLELDCGGGNASYQARTGGFSDGTQSLVALTRLGNSGCQGTSY